MHGHRESVAKPGEPFEAQARPASAILCGDFNFKPEDPEHARMTETAEPARLASWTHGKARTHDRAASADHRRARQTWPQYCCDFVFVTDDLADRVEDVTVDQRDARHPTISRSCCGSRIG